MNEKSLRVISADSNKKALKKELITLLFILQEADILKQLYTTNQCIEKDDLNELLMMAKKGKRQKI